MKKKQDVIRMRHGVASSLTAVLTFSAVLIFAPYCSTAMAETRTVTSEADHGTGTLRQAIENAVAGDTISFTQEMKGKTIALTSGDLKISKNLTITGLGPENLTVSGDGSNRVFTISPSITAVISGLTIAKGTATRAELGGVGGAIFNRGILTLDNVTISGSTAFYSGGAITNQMATLHLKNSRIEGNSVIDTLSGSYGGGIDNYMGTVDIVATTFTNNTAVSGGAAIRNNCGTMTIAGSTISNNSVSNGQGGGIFNTGNYTKPAALTVNSSSIIGNSARIGAGLYNYAVNPASVTITNTTISGNSAVETGGGIYNYATSGPASVSISYSTITGNKAERGAGILNRASQAEVNASMTVLATIIAGNTWNDCAATGSSAIFTSSGFNLTGNGTGCSIGAAGDITTTDSATLFLSTPTIFGGTTATHPLLPGSAALDLIPQGTAGCGDPVATDQRGETRPQGSNCDIGAYERSVRVDQSFTFDMADAMKAYQIYRGKKLATAQEALKLDIAPLGSDGVPVGNMTIDDGDVMLIIRRIVGIW